jgi:toxin FitB
MDCHGLGPRALAKRLTVATRNAKDFENIDGLTLANPWQTSAPH